MPTPTQAQMDAARTNLARMQKLNDHIHDYGQDKINNAFLLLSEPSDDPGSNTVLDILAGVFSGLGSLGGPIGSALGTLAGDLLLDWGKNTPPELNTTFANFLERFSKTSLLLDTTLANISAGMPDNWNNTYGGKDSLVKVSDLATGTFPKEIDPLFDQMANTALLALDKSVWTTVLKTNFFDTVWSETSYYGNPDLIKGTKDKPPLDFIKKFYAKHPAYYITYTWHKSTGCSDMDGWLVPQRSLGAPVQSPLPGGSQDGTISNDACHYLFRDSIPGVVTNPDGLFTRAEVFDKLGLTKKEIHSVDAPPPPVASLSKAYLRAAKEGRSIGTLYKAEGREALRKQVVDKAAADPVFAYDLQRDPHGTLQDYFGLMIPETINLHVIREDNANFAIVLPPSDS